MDTFGENSKTFKKVVIYLQQKQMQILYDSINIYVKDLIGEAIGKQIKEILVNSVNKYFKSTTSVIIKNIKKFIANIKNDESKYLRHPEKQHSKEQQTPITPDHSKKQTGETTIPSKEMEIPITSGSLIYDDFSEALRNFLEAESSNSEKAKKASINASATHVHHPPPLYTAFEHRTTEEEIPTKDTTQNVKKEEKKQSSSNDDKDLFRVIKEVCEEELYDILDDGFCKWMEEMPLANYENMEEMLIEYFTYLVNENSALQTPQMLLPNKQNILFDAFSNYFNQSYPLLWEKIIVIRQQKTEQQVLKYFQKTNQKHPNEMLNVLKNGTLPEIFRCLSVLDKYTLNENELNELRKLLPKIISKTKIYVSTFTSSKIISAKTMKKDCQDFLQILKDKNDAETLKTAIELESLWNVIDGFQRGQSCVDQLQTASNVITKVQKWFTNQPVQLFSNKQISKHRAVEEVLKNSNFDDQTAQKLSQIICKTIDVVKESDDLKWEKRLYIYDNKTKCSVAFANENYFIDHYGNLYCNESDFLQILRFFSGHFDIVNQHNIPLDVDLPNNDEFIEIILKAFKRIQHGYAFYYFISHTKEVINEAVNALKKMKIFFLFFYTIEKYTKYIRIFFYLKQEKLQLIFYNFDYYEININTFINGYHNFETFFKNLKLDSIRTTIPYTISLDSIGINYTSEELDKYESKIDHALNKTKKYTNMCHYIAAQIIKFIRTEYPAQTLLTNLELSNFKYIVYWVAAKFEDEKKAIIEFKKNEENIKNNYYNLITAVNGNEKPDQFSDIFHVVYGFTISYTPIRNMLLKDKNLYKKVMPNMEIMPELNNENEKICLTVFFKYLSSPILFGILNKSDACLPGKAKEYTESLVQEYLSKIGKDGLESSENQFNQSISKEMSSLLTVYNILLFGATGTGKSTFVNAIANYFAYETLDEAIEVNEPICLAPTHFTVTKNDFKDISINMSRINSTDIDNEDYGNVNSCTQEPRVYSFYNDEVCFNVIDIPAIDRPDNFQHSKNKKIIAEKIKEFTEIHGVFIFVKASDAGLTIALKYNLSEILMMLFSSCMPYIMFVITASRVAHFNPGTCMKMLQDYVREIKEKKGLNIELSQNTVFCLDNEAYIYQCGWNKSEEYREEFGPLQKNYSRSWEISRDVVFEMFQQMFALSGHSEELYEAKSTQNQKSPKIRTVNADETFQYRAKYLPQLS